MYPTLRLLIECTPLDSLSAFTLASFLGFPTLEHEYVYVGRAWYLLSCDHEIGPEFLEKKGSILRVVRPNLRSMLCVYSICSLIATFTLFSQSLGMPTHN